ncbi:hypothetical protein LCGC14_0470530 [marine sediment metagenome]|uniref:Uncharacterized protein n=1 Tax=marine sediment metagenome TaxID=412755 RepID=A0A0F9SHH4_9ZZZZ
MNDVIMLSNVRLSFPHLAEPQRQKNEITGVERVSYNGEFIMPETDPGFQSFLQKYGQLALADWKEHSQQVMGLITNDRKLRCFGRGEEKINKKTFQPYDGYVGQVYITAGKNQQPQVIQADGKPIDPTNTMLYQQLTRKMYGGCWINAAVKPWLQNNTHGRAIRCDLIAVQFSKDGDPFGEAPIDTTGMFNQVDEPVAAPITPGPAMPAAPFGTPAATPVTPVSLPPFMMQ